ncbi:MAG: DarT ssDNA thymidine ADP-ribosyltransferase family protein [Actinomycetes bacterium]
MAAAVVASSVIPVMHFTHVDHLRTIAARGLLADELAQAEGLLSVDVGNREIKSRRRRRQVRVQPGGVVADYVPFYFAPRSPGISGSMGGGS